MRYSLPRDVEYIIDTLNKSGYRADVVGGAVRDMYLGRDIGDYDITTSALPETVKKIFKGVRTIDTGLKHGTVTLHINGANYEVTTYRRDGDYLDSRHPDSVEFTGKLEEDVLRRDFTMNALCYNERDGITDLVGGIADINRRIIRTVGDPRVRFSEDALRILRALRFSATLDFTIEDKTAEAIHELSHLLLDISKERIYSEWQKLIGGENAYLVILEFSDVISVFLPMLSLRLPSEEKFKGAGGFARMLSLFALGSSEGARDFEHAMLELKTDRASRELGVRALELLSSGIPKDERGMLHSFSTWGTETAELACQVGEAIGVCGNEARELVRAAKSAGLPYRIADLAVRGDDIAALGYSGKEIGEMLQRLLFAVIDGECGNERNELLSLAAKR